MGNTSLLVRHTHEANSVLANYPGPFAMAEPGFSLRRLEEVDERGAVGSNEQEPPMKSGVSCVALGFGLLTETLFALGQTCSPMFVAQGPSSAPPSASPCLSAAVGRSGDS
jgi:hypothetical protein